MMNFKEEYFALIDFSDTHNQFLFRSIRNAINVDLLFEGVFFYHGSLSFQNCELFIAGEKEIDDFKDISGLSEWRKDQRIYVIKKDSSVCFLGASKVSYQINKLPPTETSIPIKLEKQMESEGDLQEMFSSVIKGKEPFKKKGLDWIEILFSKE